MIRVLSKDEVLANINECYVIIVPPEDELYYKKKYFNAPNKFITMKSFILENYDGGHFLATAPQCFVMMYNAYLEVNESLKKYKNINGFNFIKDLVKTYDKFYDYDLIDNDKTHDLKIIYDKYEQLLLGGNLINERLVLKHVLENTSFNGKCLFLDVKQLSDLETSLIKKMGVNGEVLITLDGFDQTLNDKLKTLVSNQDINFEDDSNDFQIKGYYALNDVEDELEHVLNDVTKKIMEGNHYRDFLIVSPDINTYEPYMSMIFDFPFTLKKVSGTLASRFVKLFSLILNGDFSCENFINLLKLDLFSIDLKLLDKLDNYVYEWNLEKQSFYLPFKDGKNNKLLEEFNKLREDIINPLRFFLQNIVGQNGPKLMIKELWTYLGLMKIDEQLFDKDPEGYNNLVSLSECINDYFDREISVIDFFELLDCLVNEQATTQKMVDEVLVCNVDDACYHDKKFIYLIGASEDLLPREFKVGGLLSEQDVKPKSLTSKVSEFLSRESSLFRRLIKNDNVVISYHKLSTDLRLKTPSSYVGKKVLKDGDNLYNKKLIINHYASMLSDDKVNKLCDDDDLIKKINTSNKHDLSAKISKQSALKLYSSNLSCSPSSIETYEKCRFYHLCQYGLKLKAKEKRLFDNREVGSLVHYVLENVIKNDFVNVNVNNLESKVSSYAFKYLEENGKVITKTTRYVVNQLVKSSVLLINNMISEQEISDFKPRYVEFRINDESIVKPVLLKLNEGDMNVSGIVDRVDVYETDDKYYYRVIDYKTGGKKLRLDDMLEGLNLQMLLYLLAIKESGSVTDKTLVPSAVLYYPAVIKEKQVTRGLSEEQLRKSVKERFIADGVINRDDEVIKALGGDEAGTYVNAFSRGKLNEEKIFGTDQLELLLNNIKKVIKEAGDNIMSGRVDVNPVGGRVNACDFCKFSSICGFDKESDRVRKLKNYKNTEVFKMLEGDYNA